MGEKMNVGELSYCQLMERMLRAEQRVAELEEQLQDKPTADPRSILKLLEKMESAV